MSSRLLTTSGACSRRVIRMSRARLPILRGAPFLARTLPVTSRRNGPNDATRHRELEERGGNLFSTILCRAFAHPIENWPSFALRVEVLDSRSRAFRNVASLTTAFGRTREPRSPQRTPRRIVADLYTSRDHRSGCPRERSAVSKLCCAMCVKML